jgi:hypothetical protein
VGLWATFAQAFTRRRGSLAVRPGFFQAVDGAPPIGYRAQTGVAGSSEPTGTADATRGRVVVLTGAYAGPLIDGLLSRTGVTAEVLTVENRFFGGNIAVAGLLCGADVRDAIARDGGAATYLLPDACLTNGRFLDGVELDSLGAEVRAVETDGAALRRELESLAGHR